MKGNIQSLLTKIEHLEEKIVHLEAENQELKEQFNFYKVFSNKLELKLANEKEKFKKAIEFLNDSLDLEVDLDHYNLHTDLGTISFVNVNKEMAKNLEVLKEVLDNDK